MWLCGNSHGGFTTRSWQHHRCCKWHVGVQPPATPQDVVFTYELRCGNLTSRANVTLQAPQVGGLVAKNDFYTYPASIGATASSPGILINDVIPAECDATLTIAVDTPLYGTIAVEADGTFTYTPDTFPADNREELNYTITCNGVSSTGVIILIPTQGCDSCSDFAPIWYVNYAYSNIPVGGNEVRALLWRWDQQINTSSTPVATSDYYWDLMSCGDVIFTPLGDPLFCITLPGYDGNGQGHLIQGLPLGSTYTNANLWRIKLGSGVTWPFNATVNINKINWLETSHSNRSDQYYILGRSFPTSYLTLVSTAEATRGQILCPAIAVPAGIHRGEGDISLAADRQLYINGYNALHRVNVDPNTLCPLSITPNITTFPNIGSVSGAVVNDGAASVCRLSTTFISGRCFNGNTNWAQPCPMGAALLQPPAITGQSWIGSPYQQVPPTFPPFQIWPVPGGGSNAPVGGANQPECFTATVNATSDTFIMNYTGPTRVQAPGVMLNDITPTYRRPLGATPATVTVVTNPTQGSLTLRPDGSFDYTPTNNPPTVVDSFTYTITCGSLTATGTVSLTLPVAPVAVDDTISFTLVSMFGKRIYMSDGPIMLTNDNVPCKDWTITITQLPNIAIGKFLGLGTPNVNNLFPNGGFDYEQTQAGAAVANTFKYRVNCNGRASNEATVTLTPAARSGIGGWQAPGVGAGRRRDRLSSDAHGGRHGHIAALEDVLSPDYEEDNWEDYSAV